MSGSHSKVRVTQTVACLLPGCVKQRILNFCALVVVSLEEPTMASSIGAAPVSVAPETAHGAGKHGAAFAQLHISPSPLPPVFLGSSAWE